MRTDNLQQFIKLRRELTQEKDQISRRLAQINDALGDLSLATAAADEPPQPRKENRPPPRAPQSSGSGARSGSGAGGKTGGTAKSGVVARSMSGGPQASAGAAAVGGSSLREHVFAVLRDGPKTKEEVLQAVQKRGYKFQTKDPLNSLGVILYGKNPKFNRVDGRFAMPSGSGSTSGGASRGGGKKGGGGRRAMSPEARERIAAAQRARWAAARGGRGR